VRVASALIFLAVWVPRAEARLGGVVASGCGSCHGNARAPAVTISLDPASVPAGGTATITVRVAASSVGGFYLSSFTKGVFHDLPGQGTRLATPNDVVHAAPKAASGGQVTFQVQWTAPAIAGTVDFQAYGVAANGDRTSGGDAAGETRLSVAVGCQGVELYVDADNDGYGSTLVPKEQVCPGTPGFAAQAGDCNDYLAGVHPGAPERCNGLDDNCNGQTDEGLDAVTVYRDADGDGYGARGTSDSHQGCTMSGYVSNQDDCDDRDKGVHPGAAEVCNNKDDNCDGSTDEGAKATCGQGWCQRYAQACDPQACTPGKPRAEECNLFDDDCDGVIDNGARCDDGKVCFGGRCLVADDAKAAAEAQGALTADGGVPPSPAAPDAGATAAAPAARPRQTASACAYATGGAPPLVALALAGLIARSARGRGGRPRRCRRPR
jgi:hypothetical protein